MTGSVDDVGGALDALLDVAAYCEDAGHDDLAAELNDVYQRLGARDIGEDDD